MLKIFHKCRYSWGATKHSVSVHACIITINFEKIFSKMLDYFRNFRKLNLSKISRYTVVGLASIKHIQKIQLWNNAYAINKLLID